MKISRRDLKLLMVLGGLLIFLLLYSLVFNNFQGKADQIEAEINSTLRPRLQTLQSYEANLPAYQAGIEENRASIKETLANVPGNIENEDSLSYILTLETDNEVDVQSVDFGTKTLLRNFSGAMEVNGADTMLDMNIYSVPTTFVSSMTYDQAKKVLDYIYAAEKQSAVDSVALSYAAETGKLTGSITLLQLFVDYEGCEYIPEPIPKVHYGVADLFGTGNQKAAPAQEESQEEPEEVEEAND